MTIFAPGGDSRVQIPLASSIVCKSTNASYTVLPICTASLSENVESAMDSLPIAKRVLPEV